jgi:hypothetical protein
VGAHAKASYTREMDEILQANIFFFIASFGVVLFTLLTCVILYHIIKLLRSIRNIVERVDEGSEVIAEDVAQLRAYVTQGSLVSHIMSFVFGTSARSASKTRKKSNDVDNQ